MKKPMHVVQDENEHGEFWYVLKGGNHQTTAVSEMFPSRSNAKRAARRFIASIDPVPVTFTYWTGPLPIVKDPTRPLLGFFSTDTRQTVTETIRQTVMEAIA